MNIGDYVRTKKGYIRKIISTDIDETAVFVDTHTWVRKKDVIKSSPNIIDLIGVGDYVNGDRVIALEKDVDKRNIYPSNLGAKIFTDYELQGNWYFGIQEEDIKTVITKEQIKQMEYKL